MAYYKECIEMTCENCEYEYESCEGEHCRHCIHNATDNFEPKSESNAEKEIRVKAIDEFVSALVTRLTDAIYQKDVESMTNLINGVAEELKSGE